MKKIIFISGFLAFSLAQAKATHPQTAVLTCSFDLKCALDSKEKITWNIDLGKKTAVEKKTVLNPRAWEVQSHTTIYQKKLSYMGQEMRSAPNSSPEFNQIILTGNNWDDNAYLMVVVYQPGNDQLADVTLVTSGGGGACSDQSLSCKISY